MDYHCVCLVHRSWEWASLGSPWLSSSTVSSDSGDEYIYNGDSDEDMQLDGLFEKDAGEHVQSTEDAANTSGDHSMRAGVGPRESSAQPTAAQPSQQQLATSSGDCHKKKSHKNRRRYRPYGYVTVSPISNTVLYVNFPVDIQTSQSYPYTSICSGALLY